MPKMTTCQFGDRTIGVDEALDIKPKNNSSLFSCPECGEAVRPHRASKIQEAHFEHLERNQACSLSDPPR